MHGQAPVFPRLWLGAKSKITPVLHLEVPWHNTHFDKCTLKTPLRTTSCQSGKNSGELTNLWATRHNVRDVCKTKRWVIDTWKSTMWTIAPRKSCKETRPLGPFSRRLTQSGVRNIVMKFVPSEMIAPFWWHGSNDMIWARVWTCGRDEDMGLIGQHSFLWELSNELVQFASFWFRMSNSFVFIQGFRAMRAAWFWKKNRAPFFIQSHS